MVKAFALLAVLVPLAACAMTTNDDEDVGSDEGAMVTGSVTKGGTFTTTARVNLREGPSTDDEVKYTLAIGKTVTALDAEPTKGFYHVHVEGSSDDGWVFGQYLKGTNGTADPPSESVPTASESGDGADFKGRKYTNRTMLWEGNWAFLTKCSSYSRGYVVMYCNEKTTQSMVDNEAWIAVPGAQMSRTLCGKRARICKGGKCIVAKVLDKGVTSNFEGSTPVLKFLGEETGFRGCNSSFGTASGVDITME